MFFWVIFLTGPKASFGGGSGTPLGVILVPDSFLNREISLGTIFETHSGHFRVILGHIRDVFGIDNPQQGPGQKGPGKPIFFAEVIEKHGKQQKIVEKSYNAPWPHIWADRGEVPVALRHCRCLGRFILPISSVS